ncbi:OmpA family protein [Vibrio cincinnatiensis]|nr:OmpA family protein [Vibrio cincinnatiensis]MCG3729163.1 OmpA family protein [Vibrio cincinnatiensis]MCG3767211.1 OmpA family protein [Vibrio cincinnatiensis]
MKGCTLLLCLLLSGCGSFAADRMFSSNLLDTAPQNDVEVLYPDWSGPSQSTKPQTKSSVTVKTAPNATSQNSRSTFETQPLLAFLASHGFEYELQPGEHTLVKLKRTALFKTGSVQLSNDAIRWVSVLGRFLAQYPAIDVVVEGHTDNTGSERLNDGLSLRRAEAIKRVLTEQKVAKEAVYTRGYGEHLPSCLNSSAKGRACNRRVEVSLIIPEYLAK